jgi:hypothetical protein
MNGTSTSMYSQSKKETTIDSVRNSSKLNLQADSNDYLQPDMYSRYLENSRNVREQKEKSQNQVNQSLYENIERHFKLIEATIQQSSNETNEKIEQNKTTLLEKMEEINEKCKKINQVVQLISTQVNKETVTQDQSVQTEKVLKVRKRAEKKNITIHSIDSNNLRRSPRFSSEENGLYGTFRPRSNSDSKSHGIKKSGLRVKLQKRRMADAGGSSRHINKRRRNSIYSTSLTPSKMPNSSKSIMYTSSDGESIFDEKPIYEKSNIKFSPEIKHSTPLKPVSSEEFIIATQKLKSKYSQENELEKIVNAQAKRWIDFSTDSD